MARLLLRGLSRLGWRELPSGPVQGGACVGVGVGRASHKDVGSFNKHGEPAADWKKKLTPEQYYVTREKGTEPPFSGALLNNTEPGMYHCVCCDSPLFSSEKKFCSGTGWPSFTEAHGTSGSDESEANILRRPDYSRQKTRVEVVCKQRIEEAERFYGLESLQIKSTATLIFGDFFMKAVTDKDGKKYIWKYDWFEK